MEPFGSGVGIRGLLGMNARGNAKSAWMEDMPTIQANATSLSVAAFPMRQC
jgi:hypothetical protein